MQDAFAEMTGARTVPRVTWLTWLVEVMLALENSNNPYRPGEFDMAKWKHNCQVFMCVFLCFCLFVLSIEHEKFPAQPLVNPSYPMVPPFFHVLVRSLCVGHAWVVAMTY